MSSAPELNKHRDGRKAVVTSAVIALVFIALVTVFLWAGYVEIDTADLLGPAIVAVAAALIYMIARQFGFFAAATPLVSSRPFVKDSQSRGTGTSAE